MPSQAKREVESSARMSPLRSVAAAVCALRRHSPCSCTETTQETQDRGVCRARARRERTRPLAIGANEAIAALVHDALEEHPNEITRDGIAPRSGVEVLAIVDGWSDTSPDDAGGPRARWQDGRETDLVGPERARPEVRRVARRRQAGQCARDLGGLPPVRRVAVDALQRRHRGPIVAFPRTWTE